ncbi:MAG: phage head closure protein [Pseudomonadota bacterium]|nr:phage head closure protein [Pseudomonadota bacterium]
MKSVSRLRHKLTLQQETQTADGAGGYMRTWTNVADLWAEILSVSGGASSGSRGGKEILFAGQLQSQVTHKILLRYRDGVIPGMRLVFENRAFNIVYLADTGENRDALELLVIEGAAA